MREIKRGDIYKADLSPVVGSEQGGIRPVVIVQNDMGNRYSPTIIVVPITTRQNKKDLPTHTKIKNSSLPKESIALMEQIRTIDKSRLTEFIGVLSQNEMNRITEALRISIDVWGGWMNEALKKEMIYLCIFSILKRVYQNGEISKETFEKLNFKNAECQGCKPLTIWKIAHLKE